MDMEAAMDINDILITVTNIALLSFYFILFSNSKRISNKRKYRLFFMTLVLFCNNFYYGFSIPLIVITAGVNFLGLITYFIKDDKLFMRYFHLYESLPLILSVKMIVTIAGVR